MILEEETFEAYGYYPSDLKPKSHKPILAACDNCGSVRTTSKNHYYALCRSCNKKGDKHPNFGKHSLNFCIPMSEEQKALIRAAMKGNTNALGHICTDEQNAKQSAARKGANNPGWRGGPKLSNARKNAKRREMRCIFLMPLTEGEVGHHFTDEDVIGIPAEVHNSIGGRRKKHRTKVLQWLKANDKKKYLKVLCVLAKQ